MKNKSSIRFGTYLGSTMILTHLLWFVMDMLLVTIADQLTSAILFLIFITLSIKELRDVEGDGYLKFKQAFLQGVKTCAYAAILYGAYYFVFLEFIDPEFLNKSMDFAEEKMYELAELGFMDEDSIEEQMLLARERSTSMFTVMSGILSHLFWGSIASLIIGAIIKKNNPNPFEA